MFAVALLVLTTAAATPCAACSCAAGRSLVSSASAADVVFVGTFVGTRSPALAEWGVAGSSDPVAKVFQVSEVRKGEVTDRTEVLTAESGSSCGLEVEEGRDYVVVARDSGEGLRGDLCGGTRPLAATTPADLDSVGASSAPTSGTLVVDLPPVQPAFVDVASQPVVWVPAAGLVAGLATLVVVLRRRRHG